MKKLFVFVPAIFLVLFLINSFLLKEKEAGAKTTEGSTLCKAASLCDKPPMDSVRLAPADRNKPAQANIVFKSTDGGETWMDISQGLPGNLGEVGIRGDCIFANDQGLFLKVGSERYHSTANATAAFWTKDSSPGSQPGEFGKYNSIAPGKPGTFAYNYWGVNLKSTNGTSVWSPVFDNSHEPRIRSVFETAGGTIFLGTDKGLFKTDNSGTTWKHVYKGAFVGHLAELNGVLVAIGMRKIIRSTDHGENWAQVPGEDGVAFDVKKIKDGFAAITTSSLSDTRTLRTSYDGGKTWQPIDAGRPEKAFIDSIWRTWDDRPLLKAFATSITQVGENFLCIHPQGIFKSSDKGKTWKLLLSSKDGKIFNLFGSGKLIYAIPGKGGC